MQGFDLPRVRADIAARVSRLAASRWRRALLAWSVGVGVAIALSWMIAPVARGESPWARGWVAPAVLAVVSLVLHRQKQCWLEPRKKLIELLRLIRNGEAAIEELRQIQGPLSPLAEECRALLHDLRRARQEAAALDQDHRRQIEQRTEAMQRLIGSLRQQAMRDPLTGLYNRRMLDKVLPELVDRCRAEKVELTLVMMDLDHFKQVNDQLGHAQGDALLRDVGRLITSCIREQDMAFRHGGDEFLVVLTSADEPTGRQMGTRLAGLVENLAKPLRLTPSPRLAVGVVAVPPSRSVGIAELLKQVDARLYERKQSNRAWARAG